MLPHTVRAVTLASVLLLTAGSPVALAQAIDPDHRPIGWFAVDARGAWVTLPDDATLAEFLSVPQENLATHGPGLIVGGHVYPVRLGRWVALGFGGELLFSRGSKTLSPDDDENEDGVVEAPTVKARLSAVSPQFSLNFGGRDGWSYLSGGIGWSKFSSEVVAETAAGSISTGEAPRASTINYGGGARWFMKEHLAFMLDLRFYTIRPQEATPARPTLKRQRLLTLSAGVSFK